MRDRKAPVRVARRGGLQTAPTQRSAIVVSHGPFCLDGITAAACVGRFYGESRATPVFAHPSEVDRVIERATRNSKRPMDLWITDITWKESETEKRFRRLSRKGWRIFWMDHHSIALDKKEEEIRALGLTGWAASRRFSAARLVYNYLRSGDSAAGRAPAGLKRFEPAVLLADDNDRWLHRRPGSRKLALTVAALGGMVAYRELMRIGPDLGYSPRMQAAYRSASRELSESVALANRTRADRRMDASGLTVVTALCKGYTSEVADALRRSLMDDSKEAIILLYNLEDQRISLRKSPACGVDLARLAESFGGGGHPAAAGFELSEARDYLQNYLMDRIQRALKE